MSDLRDKPNLDEKNKGFVFLFFIIGIIVSLIFGWVIFPKILYSKKNQPIDFNHLIHVKIVKNGCESCHFFRADGSFSGVPKLTQCSGCHLEVQSEEQQELNFVQNYLSKNREVPWSIYSKQPACVFFSHAAHVKGANLNCVICHGYIAQSEHSRPYEQNRISGYSRDIWGKDISGIIKVNNWDRMKMDDCASCHESIKTNKSKSVQTQKEGCFVCHK